MCLGALHNEGAATPRTQGRGAAPGARAWGGMPCCRASCRAAPDRNTIFDRVSSVRMNGRTWRASASA